MKLFRTSNTYGRICHLQFSFDLPSVIIEKRTKTLKTKAVAITLIIHIPVTHRRLKQIRFTSTQIVSVVYIVFTFVVIL